MADILLMEDDFVLAQDYCEALEAAGHNVALVSTATEAMQRCASWRFHLAIVDVFIVESHRYIADGGLTFIAKLRIHNKERLKTPKNIPIIAISGGALTGTDHCPLKNAEGLGASFGMTKPFDVFELVEQVNRRL